MKPKLTRLPDQQLLQHYTYMLKRAVSNEEYKTAYDAAASIYNHFQSVYGEEDTLLLDERECDDTWV